jgi:hypothetical protein
VQMASSPDKHWLSSPGSNPTNSSVFRQMCRPVRAVSIPSNLGRPSACSTNGTALSGTGCSPISRAEGALFLIAEVSLKHPEAFLGHLPVLLLICVIKADAPQSIVHSHVQLVCFINVSRVHPSHEWFLSTVCGTRGSTTSSLVPSHARPCQHPQQTSLTAHETGCASTPSFQRSLCWPADGVHLCRSLSISFTRCPPATSPLAACLTSTPLWRGSSGSSRPLAQCSSGPPRRQLWHSP